MTEAACSRINHLSVDAEGETPKAKRRAAIAAWSAMVGAVIDACGARLNFSASSLTTSFACRRTPTNYFARGQGVTKFGGEDFTMSDNDHDEAKKLSAYRRDRDLQRRSVKIDDAIRGITDDDRKMMINESLRKVHSALSVS
jgi:hypothetical protein